MAFGQRLKEVRTYTGMSQAEAAPKLHIAKDTLSRYERGEVSPTAEVLMLMAIGLGVNADWLLTGEGQRERGEWGVMPQLSNEEQKWLHLYRMLTNEQRAAAGLLVEHLACFNQVTRKGDEKAP